MVVMIHITNHHWMKVIGGRILTLDDSPMIPNTAALASDHAGDLVVRPTNRREACHA